jgi:hypothetical protein
MRILNASALVMFVLSGSVYAQGWAEFFDRAEYFSINFPGTPEVNDINYDSEYGVTLPARTYTLQNGDIHYQVTVVNYNEAERIYQELPDRTDEGNNKALWLYDQRASVAYAARNIRQRGGEITFDAWHHIDMVEGHQLQVTNSDKSRTYAGMYLHEGRLYIVEATVPEGGLPQGLFQQSLTFLDEEGARIRYQLYPDGSHERVPLP